MNRRCMIKLDKCMEKFTGKRGLFIEWSLATNRTIDYNSHLKAVNLLRLIYIKAIGIDM